LPTEPEEVAGRLEEVVKTYRTSTGEVRALRGISATLPAGAFTAVVGPSGSGKSSLLRLLAGLDRPTAGSVGVGGVAVERVGGRALRRFRRTVVGYVFQRPSDNFLPHLTVAEHLRLAGRISHRPPPIPPGELLDTLGIAHRLTHRPAELSGGEQQRAAIAEVLMGGAGIIVADEPTAELDSASARHVLEAMRVLVDSGVTFVLATHDPAVMRKADVSLELDHGVLASSSPRAPAEPSGLRRGPTSIDEEEAEPPVLCATGLEKTYRRGDELVHALDDVDLRLVPGELVGLVGRSGSGKTTLLNIVAGWERQDAGELVRPGEASPGWQDIAMVPQKLGLMNELTIRENVEHPLRLTGSLEEGSERVDDLLGRLGLAHLQDRAPRETSLGEQQRASVARALVRTPRLLLADEPTGHQDAGFARTVIDALRRAAETGTACLVATHNERVIPELDRTLRIADGRLVDEAWPHEA
jgi:ABC-type lipoprotein export system ATPase subunit